MVIGPRSHVNHYRIRMSYSRLISKKDRYTLLDIGSRYHNWKRYLTFQTFFEFDLSISLEGKCDGAARHLYDFLLVCNNNRALTNIPFWAISLNMRDIDLEISVTQGQVCWVMTDTLLYGFPMVTYGTTQLIYDIHAFKLWPFKVTQC